MTNQLIVISGPSGVGKGTIVKLLTEKLGCALSVSCTTRPPRTGEVDGKSYFFITKEKFLKLIEENGLLEYSEHFENYYGTPRAFVEETLRFSDVILEIEVDGALQVKKAYPEALLILVVPPDMQALNERLYGRGTENAPHIQERISRAEYELSKKNEYDFTVVNDVLEDAVAEITEIIKSRKYKE